MQSVRRRIAEILKEKGLATVAELAGELGMAQVSVRHHLDILIGEDLVECAGVRRRDGAGRPSQIYALAPEASRLFPQRHDVLATGILSELKAILPVEEVRALLLRLAEKRSSEVAEASPGQSVAERLDEVVEFMRKNGYEARWELRGGRYELYACNCPYVGVADQHPELCAMDQAMIKRFIPQATRLTSRVLDGSTRCTYVIELSPGRTSRD